MGTYSFSDLTGVHDHLLGGVVAEYSAKAREVPEAFRDVHPSVLKRALRQADGVWTRLEVIDGEIIVHNRPVWS
jgi:hypothetical protein